MDDIALVTVTFNSSAVASHFAASAHSFTHVFVIDNASTDDSAERFRAEIRHAHVLQQATNLGFGTANNIGLRAASQLGLPYVLFLNPDCRIDLESVCLLKHTLQRQPDAAVASPAMLGKDNAIKPLMRWDFRKPYAAKSPQTISVSSLEGQITDQACIDGACFMVRTDLFLEVGAFTEDLFLFCEEDDVNLRIARAGYASLFNPSASCTHIGAGSTPHSLRIELRKAYNVRWSRLFMTDQYVGSAARLKEASRIIAVAPFALLFFALSFKRQYVLRWLGWGMAGIDGLLLSKFFRRWI